MREWKMRFAVVRRSVIAAIALIAGLAVAGVLLAPRGGAATSSPFGAFTVVQAASAAQPEPFVPDASARATALVAAAARRPDLAGLSVVSSRMVPGLLKISDSTGTLRFDQGTATNCWLVQVTAPAQGGYAHVNGLIVIDADTGAVSATSIVQYNDVGLN